MSTVRSIIEKATEVGNRVFIIMPGDDNNWQKLYDAIAGQYGFIIVKNDVSTALLLFGPQRPEKFASKQSFAVVYKSINTLEDVKSFLGENVKFFSPNSFFSRNNTALEEG